MDKLKIKLDRNEILMIVAILILIIVSLSLYDKKVLQPKRNQEKSFQISESGEKQESVVVVPRTEEEIIKKLSQMGERDRMEYYCGEYFRHLENEEYNEAYALLYDEFKKNYFPTVDDFIAYVKKTYPSQWALSYSDITRQGNLYVLRLEIYDVLGSKENEKVQFVVIRENTYNDFVLSFQVI